MGGSQALAFGLVAASGAATFLGAIGVLFNKSRLDTSFLSVAMAASAGVMIYVSFVEIFSQKSTGYFVDSGMSEVTSSCIPRPRGQPGFLSNLGTNSFTFVSIFGGIGSRKTVFEPFVFRWNSLYGYFR